MDAKNCHIQKEMKDRLDRRKYGLRCEDDTSNYNLIYSYRNKLQCEVVDMSCYSDWKACETRTEILTPCEVGVNIDVDIDLIDDRFYTFTATATNTFGTVTYSWTYDDPVWSDEGVSGNVFEASADSDFVLTNTDVTVLVTDERGCQGTFTVNVIFKGGCTDPNANNYDPEATYQVGECLYDPVVLVTTYTCNPDTSATMSVTATGGVPPYSITGTQNGAIVPNGVSYGSYATDSLGNISNTVTGTIVCPFDCGTVTIDPGVSYVCDVDGNGFNTGTGVLSISPSGGTAPYVITGATDGQAVSDTDVFNITVTDANGCVGNANVTIDCVPFVPPLDITCEEISFDFESSLILSNIVSIFIAELEVTGSIVSLTPGVIIEGYDFTVTNNLNPDPVLQCLSLTSGVNTCSCTPCGGTTGTPTFGPFELNHSVAFEGKPYDLTVNVTIKIRVNSGVCEFFYSYNFTGSFSKPSFIGEILQTKTQSF